MELKNKPDFEKCMDRIEAWWDCRIIDRPPIGIGVTSARPPKPTPAAPKYACLRERWLDIDRRLDAFEAAVEGVEFLAECFPRFYPNLGPEVCSVAYGSDLIFSEETSWSTPVARNIRDVLKMKPDLNAPLWKWIREATLMSIEQSQGRWITGVADLHTNGDLLASLRDPQEFALDYMDDLAGVELACRYVQPHAKLFFEDLFAPIRAAGQPGSTWGPALSRGSMYYTSCDFICMISPKFFAQTILPSIRYETEMLDRSIFHLDGPGALKQLDLLLELPRLNAIQWTYGAGNGPARRWLDLYRKIQAAGKGVEVHVADRDDLRAIMDHLRPEGLWLSCGFSVTRAEFDALLKDLQRWAAGKK